MMMVLMGCVRSLCEVLLLSLLLLQPPLLCSRCSGPLPRLQLCRPQLKHCCHQLLGPGGAQLQQLLLNLLNLGLQ